MLNKNNQNKLKKIIDNLLLINLFTVIFFAIFFYFCHRHAIKWDIHFYQFYSESMEPSYSPLNNYSYNWCVSKRY